ncbi:hypothetical protein BKA61DRAFT_611040 [Leptodontidium sp. MPI-SDFR-AT-0119]|nr:hypothetical protein BKA61DRAFT_611040 [Leptodontidium sp. MPI-SDFR-AT-0119]
MSSAGPQLPPHLAKRKRSTEEDEGPHSPPRKVQAATAPPPRTLGPTLPPTTNPDELNIDDDSSEDDYGPSLQPKKASSPPGKRILGPSLPPTKNPEELSLDDSSEDEYGPSAPKAATKPPSPPRKRVLGPAPPPGSLSERPSYPANDSSSSDSEDDYGPSLPPAPGSQAETLLLNAQAEEKARSASEAQSSKPQRAEWMLAPPTDSDWTGRVDPTKLKNRKFASGKGAKAPAEKSGISAIWTETPEEKRQRLEDEVLGRKETATSGRGGGEKKGVSKELEMEERATARRIREYNEKNRGRSLYEEREALQEKRGEKVEEDDPSKRGFDREKDMALGGRLGNGQKKEMLAKAADFGSRFQKGRYL